MVHPGGYDPARAGSYRAGAAGARYGRAGTAPGPQSRRRVLGADTSVTQLVLRLNYHPGHTRVVNAAFRPARNTAAQGGETGPFIDLRGGAVLARVLITPGMRDAGGAAAVDARGSVPVSARTRRGAAGTATASPWAAGRRWLILLALGWLVHAGLRVWFSRHQVIPLANPDETAYLVT